MRSISAMRDSKVRTSLFGGHSPPTQSELNLATVRTSAGKKLKQFPASAEDMQALAEEISRVRYKISCGFWALPVQIGGRGATNNPTIPRPIGEEGI